MKVTQIISEMTAGCVASVAMPIGGAKKRTTETTNVPGLKPAEKVSSKSKKKGPYANSLIAEGSKSKPVQEAKLDEDDLILVPGQGIKNKNGFIPHGQSRVDHEVEMAKSDLLQLLKNTKTVMMLVKDRTEDEGLEGWVQEKIIKAADYMNTLAEYLEGKRIQEMSGGVIAAGGVGEGLNEGPKGYDSFGNPLGGGYDEYIGDPYGHKEAERVRQQNLGPFYLKINGKILRTGGEIKVFDRKENAKNYALAILKRKPELKGKVFITNSPNDDSQGVAEAGYQSPHAKLAQLKAKYEAALKSPNPNMTTLRRIRDEIIKLEFDLGLKEGVAEGFSDVVKGVKRFVKGKEHPDVVAAKHAGRAVGHYNQGDIAAGDKESQRYVKTRDMHLKAKGVAEGSSENAWNSGISDEDFINKFGRSEFNRLTKKYGVSSIPVPDLVGYRAKEPTDPKVRLHRGLDGPGAKLKSIIKQQSVAEGKFTINAKTGAKLDPRTGAEMPPKEKPLTMKDMFSQPKSSAPKLTLDDVWRKVEEVVGQIFPDGDPIDWLAPWLEKHGIHDFKIGEILDRAAKKNGYKDLYDYYDSMKDQYARDNVAEGGVLKSIKRGLQGWDKNAIGPGGEKLGDPRAVVSRAKAMDIDTAKKVRAGLDDAPAHSPSGLQKRVLDRKLKGVAEGTLNEETEETSVINMFEKLVKQGRDPIDMIAHKFGWGSYELDQLARNLGFKNSADWARGVTQGRGVNTEGVAEDLSEMDNRTPSGDRREQRGNSPEEKANREKKFQGNLEKAGPNMRKKLRLPEPKKGVEEGAKVDRMVKHIASSERKLGKSEDEAENIAWATANKRGYLDNKNKKSHK